MKKQAWLILCMIGLGRRSVCSGSHQSGYVQAPSTVSLCILVATQACAVSHCFPDTSSSYIEEIAVWIWIPGCLTAFIWPNPVTEYDRCMCCRITVSGYGGPIEIIMGVDIRRVPSSGLTDRTGTCNFAETSAGLGTQVKVTRLYQSVRLSGSVSKSPTMNGNVDTIM